jgi:peptidoglycan/xylan/chitin deacetylase (PgdA/CDA1 family)
MMSPASTRVKSNCNSLYFSKLIYKLFPSVTWKVRTEEKIIFLTFDDGPVPEATPAVLDLLKSHHARATFFCVGANIEKHPGIFSRILSDGHHAANHTQDHLDGWKCKSDVYTLNIEKCAQVMAGNNNFTRQVHLPLFRPPYGKLTPAQFFAIRKKYKLVMWDVLARDWEQDRSADSCFERVRNKAQSGSIIVLHDSIKAKSRMIPALERTLDYFGSEGYRFESLAGYC